MPQRPRVNLGRHMLPGLAAVALFVVMAAVFLRAQFPDGLVETVGFDGSVTASIGYALFDLTGTMESNVEGVIASDGFLAAFEIIDIVLVAALVGAVMLARREEGGSLRTAIADGGRQLLGAGDAQADTAADADARADPDTAGATADADTEADGNGGEPPEDGPGGGEA
ncbi:MAG: NADH-quinone oxidoreductase subunit J [Haloarculaceae archaeon]